MIGKKSLVVVSAMFILLSSSLVFAGGSKEDSAVEVADQSVLVEENWGFSWEFLEDEIEFTVFAPTTGWIGIGFNPSQMMADAHYVLAYVSEGTVHARDDYGTGRTMHASDVSLGGTDDVRVISGEEADGMTRVVFALPLDSGDQYDVVFTQGETYKVLLAYGGNNANNFTGMHRKRTSLDVVF